VKGVIMNQSEQSSSRSENVVTYVSLCELQEGRHQAGGMRVGRTPCACATGAAHKHEGDAEDEDDYTHRG